MFAGKGVKPAGRAQQDAGAPNTIAGIDEARLKVVHYFDERGRPTSEVLMEIGGRLYTPINSIEWAGALRVLSGKQLERIKVFENKRAPTGLPDGVQVDVMAGEESDG
jgi:hypothetical protein